MKYAKSLSRAALLIFLLAVGSGLILKIGRDFEKAGKSPLIPQREEVPVAGGEKSSPRESFPVPDQAPVQPLIFDGAPPRIVSDDRGRFLASDPILFNSGITALREASIPRLDRVAAYLMQNPEISVEIIGHTDNLGPEPANQWVSAERAAVVRNYLAAQGIDPSRLASRGMGSLEPIETNDTLLGRQANRRIEFLVRERQESMRGTE